MLVLSRKAGQTIRLPELDIEIEVMAIRKSKVQIGIDAPPEITISRGELDPESRGIPRTTGPTDQATRGDFQAELSRLETELLALAELAAERDRATVEPIASRAIERISRLRRCSTDFAQPHETPKTISELVTVRSDVIDRLRIGKPEEAQTNSCVRQHSAGYGISATQCGVA